MERRLWAGGGKEVRGQVVDGKPGQQHQPRGALKLARIVNAGKLDVSCGFDQKGADAFGIGRCLDGF